jgi:hypothetical protein
MATDPVRKIRRRHLGHAFNLALDGAISPLADLEPSSNTPYVTATVNWEPEGTQPGRHTTEPVKASQRRNKDEIDNSAPFRPARIELENAGDEVLATFEERTPARDSIEVDLKRIQEYLESELDMAASGAVIVANSGAGVFTAVPLSLQAMMSALDAEWHDEVREQMLGSIKVAPDATIHDNVEQVQPILEAEERGHELDAVEQAEAAIGMQELGRSGAEAVAAALALGQVETLVMNDDSSERGWIDAAYNLAGAGDPPNEHPAGGDPAGIMEVDLGE